MKDPRELNDIMFEPIRRGRHKHHQLSKRKRRYLPTCNGKHSYRHRQDAESARSTLMRVAAVDYLRTYECPHGAHWHLTSQPPRTRR